MRLLRVFDNILDMLSENMIPSFYFDGQVSALDDYLEMRPEKRELVLTLIRQKRLFVGPFFCLVDEFLTDKTCFSKNLEIGLKTARRYGCKDFIGYSDSDLKFARRIIRNIVRKNENIRLIDIGTSTKETFNIIKDYTPDICILNIDIIDISKIKELKKLPYFIFVTSESTKVDSTKCLLKAKNTELIEKNLNEIINSNDFSKAKEKLINVLGKLKFDFSRNGSLFLIDSILYSYENIESNIYENLERNVYPYVANKYHTGVSNVRKCIISAVQDMYNKNYIDNTTNVLFDYFYFDDQIKPTPKLVIVNILQYLCKK